MSRRMRCGIVHIALWSVTGAAVPLSNVSARGTPAGKDFVWFVSTLLQAYDSAGHTCEHAAHAARLMSNRYKR